MSWSYLSSGPGSSDRSWIRARIGDTSSGNPLMQDEEIDMLLDDYGNKWEAGAAAARSIGAQFARQVTKQVGKLKISMAEASNSYFDLAKQLESESRQHTGGVWVGGVSNADKESNTSDTDWAGSMFTRGQFDSPYT